MFLSFGGPYRRGPKKARKPKKTPKDSWFDECTADQLKQLCKACKLTVSGTKGQLVTRLQADDFVSQYGGNKKTRMPSTQALEEGDFLGCCGNVATLDSLKEQCRKRLLQVSGKKFDLILRIVQHEKGTGGVLLKRAATEMQTVKDRNGKEIQVPVAKKRKPSKPSPTTIYGRIEKKIRSVSQKQYQSYWGAKNHAPDVCYFMEHLIESLKDYVDTEPKLVYDCYYAAVSSFVENFEEFQRPEYCMGIEGIASTIERNVLRMRPQLSEQDLNNPCTICGHANVREETFL